MGMCGRYFYSLSITLIIIKKYGYNVCASNIADPRPPIF